MKDAETLERISTSPLLLLLLWKHSSQRKQERSHTKTEGTETASSPFPFYHSVVGRSQGHVIADIPSALES